MLVKVGFSKGRTLIARLICAITKADVSHTFFYVEDEEGKTWAYEAVPRGFRRLSYEVYARHNKVKTLIDMSWPHERVKAMLDGMLGQPYGLFTFFLLSLFFIFHRRPGKSIMQNGLDCVKACLRVTRAFGMPYEAVTPTELETRLKGKP